MPAYEIRAFTAQQAGRLTGLSQRQLAYWDRTGFFSPKEQTDESGPYARLYSFRDVVGLRTIAGLRKSVPLQELRKVGRWLSSQPYEAPWASLTFYLHGRRVYFKEPKSGVVASARGERQTAIQCSLEPIAQEVRAEAEKLRERGKADVGKISRHRHVAHNAFVVSGTRIPVDAIWNFHQAGYSNARIRREYPQLRRADIQAAISFKAEQWTG